MGIWDVYLFSATESPKLGDSLTERVIERVFRVYKIKSSLRLKNS